MRPSKGDYFPYFQHYIDLIAEQDVISALKATSSLTLGFFRSLPASKWEYAYASGKWNLKELFVHVMDTERIFAYRALAFARGEKQILPSFDENQYAEHSGANQLKPEEITDAFESLRRSTISLFTGFSESVLSLSGQVPAGTVSVNALGFAICGHNMHHLNVAKERYLK